MFALNVEGEGDLAATVAPPPQHRPRGGGGGGGLWRGGAEGAGAGIERQFGSVLRAVDILPLRPLILTRLCLAWRPERVTYFPSGFLLQ
ncbi:unnamed protein product [Nesidiocoris tenuis]|uniref:Uncharacterized protein n=1 Tax=Nesidiocoris tenuis TaxID=355587 RepID=A0A6H5H8H7_9HEMI|nr:unnamed protein product [Nesidiocoris tenuis]